MVGHALKIQITPRVAGSLIAFPAPYSITVAIIDRARRLLLDYSQRLDSRDAIHVAVVLEHRLEGIISADKAFDVIPGITRFDPRDL